MIIIIGAGLSGLLIAYRLKCEDIPFKILEARNRTGGRIHMVKGKSNTPLEMGATWFTYQHQYLIKLLKELEIPHFEQYMEGTAFFQPNTNSPIQAVQLPKQAPSYRITGGTSMLINTLYEKLNHDDILLNQVVKKIIHTKDNVIVEATESYKASMVVLAVPPKLWANNISFEPSLSDELVQTARLTHTWMEDSIKAAIVYDRPFWRAKKQAGTFFSNAGPVAEFYDHSNAENSKFSLCGFINPNYRNYSIDQRKNAIIEQLKMAFGEEATKYVAYDECIWADEKYSSASSDYPIYPHQNNGNPIFRNNQFEDRLLFSSTEVSPHFGGYMEGAVFSANEISHRIKQLIRVSHE